MRESGGTVQDACACAHQEVMIDYVGPKGRLLRLSAREDYHRLLTRLDGLLRPAFWLRLLDWLGRLVYNVTGAPTRRVN